MGFYLAEKPGPIFLEVSEPEAKFVDTAEIPEDQGEVVSRIPPATLGTVEDFMEKGKTDEAIAGIFSFDPKTVAYIRDMRD